MQESGCYGQLEAAQDGALVSGEFHALWGAGAAQSMITTAMAAETRTTSAIILMISASRPVHSLIAALIDV